MSEIIINSIGIVSANEQSIAGYKAEGKEMNERCTTLKVESYAELISEIVTTSVKLTNSGNLPPKWTRTFKDGLAEKGIKQATYDRYVQNSAGLLAHEEVGSKLRKCSSSSEVLKVFGEFDLQSENKIKKFWEGADVDPIDKRAKAEAKAQFNMEVDSPSELVRYRQLVEKYFDELVESAKAKAEAEAKAKAEAEADADALNEFTEQLESVA